MFSVFIPSLSAPIPRKFVVNIDYASMNRKRETIGIMSKTQEGNHRMDEETNLIHRKVKG